MVIGHLKIKLNDIGVNCIKIYINWPLSTIIGYVFQSLSVSWLSFGFSLKRKIYSHLLNIYWCLLKKKLVIFKSISSL